MKVIKYIIEGLVNNNDIMIICLLAIFCIVIAEYCTLQFLAALVIMNFGKVSSKE